MEDEKVAAEKQYEMEKERLRHDPFYLSNNANSGRDMMMSSDNVNIYLYPIFILKLIFLH